MKTYQFYRWFSNLPLPVRLIRPAGISSLSGDDNMSAQEIYLKIKRWEEERLNAEGQIEMLLEAADKLKKKLE